jgi:hypothetical protein
MVSCGAARTAAKLPFGTARRHGYCWRRYARLKSRLRRMLAPCKPSVRQVSAKRVNGSDRCKEEVMAQDRSPWSEQDVVELKEMAGKRPLKIWRKD